MIKFLKYLLSQFLLFIKPFIKIISPTINYFSEINFEKNLFKIQKNKWSTVPGTIDLRIDNYELLKLQDNELIQKYNLMIKEDDKSYRSFYRNKYFPKENLSKVLDLGCGIGRDGIFLAEKGHEVTFADVVPANIHLIKRICKIKNLKCKFIILEKFEDYENLGIFDLIIAMGSLHHMPSKITKKIIKKISKNFEKGKTKFLMLTYPYSRWEKEGFLPFKFWGFKTDGGAPWTEYYDKEKIFFIFSNKVEIVDEVSINDEFVIFYLKPID